MNGYLGWVPHEAQTGDGIYIARGSSLPLILRSTKKKSDSIGPKNSTEFHFRLVVGAAYVDGAMDGQMLWSSPGKMKQLERICLV